MVKGILGLPRLSRLRPATRALPDVYYRAEDDSNTREIKQYGFQTQDANECSSGRGVHLFTTKDAARQWAASSQSDFRIWMVEGIDKDKLVKDKFLYIPMPKAYVYCTTDGISAKKITDTGEVL